MRGASFQSILHLILQSYIKFRNIMQKTSQQHMEYFLSSDNSGHWVLVPQPIRAWWFKYLEIPDDDERSWVLPEGCIEVGGAPESIVFSNFREA